MLRHGSLWLAAVLLPTLGLLVSWGTVDAQEQNSRFAQGLRSDFAAETPGDQVTTLQAAPPSRLMPRVLRLNVSIRSAADLDIVKGELEAVADRVVPIAPRILYVEGTR